MDTVITTTTTFCGPGHLRGMARESGADPRVGQGPGKAGLQGPWTRPHPASWDEELPKAGLDWLGKLSGVSQEPPVKGSFCSTPTPHHHTHTHPALGNPGATNSPHSVLFLLSTIERSPQPKSYFLELKCSYMCSWKAQILGNGVPPPTSLSGAPGLGQTSEYPQASRDPEF